MSKLTTMIFTLMFISTSLALSCQYTEQVLSTNPVNHLYDKSGNLYENVLNIYDFQNGGMNWGSCIWTGSFKVMNQINSEISVKINYDLQYSGCIGSHPNTIEQTQELNISPFSSISVPVSDRACCNIQILNDSLTYEFLTNVYTTSVWEKVPIAVCKQCLGKDCLNDGQSCVLPSDCGSGFCVLGICSTGSSCYQNDCKCSNNQVQCADNSRCVDKLSIDIGSKPICSFEECKTKYIDPDTGLCVKSPDQIAAEQEAIAKQEQAKAEQIAKENQDKLMYIVLFLIAAFLVGLIIYFMIKREKTKQTEEETKQLILRINAATKKIEETQKEISRLNDLLGELEHKKNKHKTDLIEIEKMKHQKEEEIRKIKQLDKDALVPYYSKYAGRMVWRNPNEDYYECYYNKNDEQPFSNNRVHRTIAKRWYKQYRELYPKDFNTYEVHHIDGDKYNNDKNNLIILTKEEHDRVTASSKLGIDALKDAGIKLPDYLVT